MEWKVVLSHTYREGIQCADWLATYSTGLEIGHHGISSLLAELKNLLLGDVIGVSTPRDILL